MNTLHKTLLSTFIILVSAQALAHKTWVLPSQTRISNEEGQWVTFDFTASNDIFYPSKPMDPDEILVAEPRGAVKPVVNVHSGKMRVVFDYQFIEKGTYRVSQVKSYDVVSFRNVSGEMDRRRGKWEEISKMIPTDASDIKRMSVHARNESYVTVGAPTQRVLSSSGKGLELIAGNHPNDLYAKESVKFGFLLNGKPLEKLNVIITPELTRFRDTQNAINLHTDSKGQIAFQFPHAGRYLLEAEHEQHTEQGRELYRYFLTLEVERSE